MKTRSAQIAFLAACGLAGAACMAAASPPGASWKVQFFHDKDNSSLVFRDMQCLSVTYCIAVGVLDEEGKQKGTAVITSDGGEHWSYSQLKELPYSLFFLNQTLGWMVTDKGIWRTDEAGRTWTKLKSMQGIERVWFNGESRGWAVGAPKTILETEDGGKKWTKVPAAAKIPTRPQDTDYNWILFAGPQRGFIAGSADPFHPRDPAELADLSTVVKDEGKQLVSILLNTSDGGQNWEPTVVRTRGRITRMRMSDDGHALCILEFPPASREPSALYELNLATRSLTPVFQPVHEVARDLAVLPGGENVLALVELSGNTTAVPIPGKLKILTRLGSGAWTEDRVDYRATARQPLIAAVDSKHIWVATDTGMILMRVAGS